MRTKYRTYFLSHSLYPIHICLHDVFELFTADGNESKLSLELLGVIWQLGQPVAPNRSPRKEVDAQLRQRRRTLRRKGHARQVPNGDVDIVHDLVIQVMIQWPTTAPSAYQLLQQRLNGLCVAGGQIMF